MISIFVTLGLASASLCVVATPIVITHTIGDGYDAAASGEGVKSRPPLVKRDGSGGGITGGAIAGIIAAILALLVLGLFAIYRLRRSHSSASTYPGAPTLKGNLTAHQAYHPDVYLPRYAGPTYPATAHVPKGVPLAVHVRPETGYYTPRREGKGVRWGNVGVRRF